MITVNNKKTFITYIGIAIAVIVLTNLISRNWFFRLDFTDNKMYSLSESSRLVVEKIDDLLTMKVYFSDNLPGEYGNNKRFLQDILEEYAAYSSGNIKFEFYQPEDDAKLEEEAQKYGIQPVQLQVIENDKMEIKKVHMGMVFLYEDKRETIPVIQTTTGLEYEITTNINKMVNEKKPTVGVANLTAVEIKNDQIQQLLSQSFNVRPVDLSNPVDPSIEVLLVNGAEDTLTAEIEANFRGYISRGGNVLIAQNRITADIQKQTAEPIQSNIFSILDEYGLHLMENLIIDKKCGQVTVSQQRGFFRMNSAVDYPFFPLVRTFSDHLIVNGLEQLRILFTSEIAFDESSLTDTSSSNAGNIIPLFYSSDQSSAIEQFYNLNPIDNPAFNTMIEPGKVLAALTTVTSDSLGGVSQIILVSDTKFLTDEGGGRIPENVSFIMNSVDYLMGDTELIGLRSREITTRPLEELEDGVKVRWKWINILLPSLLVIALGIIQWKREKNRSKILEEIYE